MNKVWNVRKCVDPSARQFRTREQNSGPLQELCGLGRICLSLDEPIFMNSSSCRFGSRILLFWSRTNRKAPYKYKQFRPRLQNSGPLPEVCDLGRNSLSLDELIFMNSRYCWFGGRNFMFWSQTNRTAPYKYRHVRPRLHNPGPLPKVLPKSLNLQGHNSKNPETLNLWFCWNVEVSKILKFRICDFAKRSKFQKTWNFEFMILLEC